MFVTYNCVGLCVSAFVKNVFPCIVCLSIQILKIAFKSYLITILVKAVMYPGVIAGSSVIVAMYHLLKLNPLKELVVVCYGVLCLLVNTLSSFSNLSVKATVNTVKIVLAAYNSSELFSS